MACPMRIKGEGECSQVAYPLYGLTGVSNFGESKLCLPIGPRLLELFAYRSVFLD